MVAAMKQWSGWLGIVAVATSVALSACAGDDDDAADELQSRVDELENQVVELEAENADLRTALSTATTQLVVETTEERPETTEAPTTTVRTTTTTLPPTTTAAPTTTAGRRTDPFTIEEIDATVAGPANAWLAEPSGPAFDALAAAVQSLLDQAPTFGGVAAASQARRWRTLCRALRRTRAPTMPSSEHSGSLAFPLYRRRRSCARGRTSSVRKCNPALTERRTSTAAIGRLSIRQVRSTTTTSSALPHRYWPLSAPATTPSTMSAASWSRLADERTPNVRTEGRARPTSNALRTAPRPRETCTAHRRLRGGCRPERRARTTGPTG